MLPDWLRHVFRDRISAATTAPLRGLYLIDLDIDPSAQEIANQRWHAAWTAAQPPPDEAS